MVSRTWHQRFLKNSGNSKWIFDEQCLQGTPTLAWTVTSSDLQCVESYLVYLIDYWMFKCQSFFVCFPFTQVRCSHLLVKHNQSRRPSSWREQNITRTKDEAKDLIQSRLSIRDEGLDVDAVLINQCDTDVFFIPYRIHRNDQVWREVWITRLTVQRLQLSKGWWRSGTIWQRCISIYTVTPFTFTDSNGLVFVIYSIV